MFQRSVLWVLILALAFLSLGRWKYHREAIYQFCSDVNSKVISSGYIYFEGLLEPSRQSLKIRNPKIHWQGEVKSFKTTLYFPKKESIFWSQIGKTYVFKGRLICIYPHQNPVGSLAIQRATVLPTLIARNVKEISRSGNFVVKQGIHRFLADRVSQFPGLQALIFATWEGEGRFLGAELEKLYRQLGLLPLIALSGQHVIIFAGIVQLGLQLIFWLGLPLRGLWLIRLRSWVFVLCASLLFISGGACPSMTRTLLMVVSLKLLRLRGRYASLRQCLGSSLAILVVFDPTLLFHPGFILSAVATAILLELVSSLRKFPLLKVYFLLSVFFPILMMPLLANLFYKLPLLAPVAQVLVAWVWEFFWIPLGFILPWLPVASESRPWLFVQFESLWNQFLEFHSRWDAWVEPSHMTVWRLQFLEWILLEFLLLTLFIWFLKKCQTERFDF